MLSKITNKNFIAILLFGFSSGLPAALIQSTLKAFLVDLNFDLTTIGFLSLVTLPYSLKFFIAPFIDFVKIPYFSKLIGHRRSWIILSQLSLIIFIALLGITGISGSIILITIFSFLVAFTSSMQDIVIDAYRIEIIDKEDQGFAASFYVYGYYVGILISGAGALALSEYMGWNLVYIIMSLFIIVGIIANFFASDKKIKSNKNININFREFFLAPIKDLITIKSWLLIFLLIALFKLPDSFAGNMLTPFLMDINFSKIEIAKILKTFGLIATFIGVFFGGVLIKKYSNYFSIIVVLVIQAVSNLLFSYLSLIGNNTEFLYFAVFTENFSSGVGNSVFVAFLSGLCNKNFSATQYSILFSIASLSKIILSSFSGKAAELFGWYNFYIFSCILAIPALLIIYLLKRRSSI